MQRMLIVGALAFVAGGQALAADLPPPMAPPPRAPATYVPAPVPFYIWGGIYFGANAGYNFGTISPTGGGNFNTSGFLGGGTVGFNYQWAAIVAGLEGDLGLQQRQQQHSRRWKLQEQLARHRAGPSWLRLGSRARVRHRRRRFRALSPFPPEAQRWTAGLPAPASKSQSPRTGPSRANISMSTS